MQIIVHRGRASPKDFGNTSNNFIWVHRSGFSGFETDISFTADEKVIIYHPHSIRPDPSKMTLEELKRSPIQILELREFLDLFGTLPDIFCCLDIKQNSEELVQKAIKAIVNSGLQKRIYLTSFQKRLFFLNIESDGKLLLKAREIFPECKTQLISTWPFNLSKIAQKYKPDAISFGWLQEPWWLRIISRIIFKTAARLTNLKKQIADAQKMGIKVWAGVFNSPEDMKYYMNLGVDGIFTDNPSLLKIVIEEEKISR